MLLFIVIPENPEFNEACFNTSHVTLYPDGSTVLVPGETCFNTSHVTLYRKPSVKSFILNRFQYITCYSLSECFRGMPCDWSCFNTSHVTLYRNPTAPLYDRKGVSIHHMLLFIVISHRTKKDCSDVSIHHMLLFIPRFIGFLSIHMSNNTPKPKEFQYFYQALLEILYF